MSRSLKKTIRRLRVTLTALVASFILSLIITPVAATDGITDINKGAVIIITFIGALLFAIVFEVWRNTLRERIPVRNRATHEWDRRPKDRTKR